MYNPVTNTINFNLLNINQLKSLYKEYKIPLNGAKNKKELLHGLLIRKQMFKPTLPVEIYKQILLYADYQDLFKLKLTCQGFNKIINNDFWKEKLILDYGDILYEDHYFDQYTQLISKKKIKDFSIIGIESSDSSDY